MFLYQSVLQDLGLNPVKALCHRYALDLNRLKTDINESIVRGGGGRFKSHLLLHWKSTTCGKALMPSKGISYEEHKILTKRYYDPFYQYIKELSRGYRALGFQNVYHLDLHSMPSKGCDFHRDPGQQRKDIVISDFKGTSCDSFSLTWLGRLMLNKVFL